MEILIIKIAASILIGFLAGPAAVMVFNRMPAKWLCEYDEEPYENPLLAEELKKKNEDPHYKRLKENPWRWVYAFWFMCLALRLSLVEYNQGFLEVQPELSVQTTQVAMAGIIACWLMLIIALADLKYMIIPDQFILLLAIASIGFAPLWKTSQATVSGFWQPFIGMLIGGGFMLLCALAGKLIFRQDAFGFGDVKLCAAMGLVLGINGIIAAVAAAVIISGFTAAAGLATGRYKKNDRKPLGPYLCGSAMAYILLVMGSGITL